MNIPTLISRLYNDVRKDYYYRDFYISTLSLIVYGYTNNTVRFSKSQYISINNFLTCNIRYDGFGNRKYDLPYLSDKGVKNDFFKSIKWYMYFDYSKSSQSISILPENELEIYINKIEIYSFQCYIHIDKLYLRFIKPPFLFYKNLNMFSNYVNNTYFNIETKLFFLNYLFKIEEVLLDEEIIHEWIIYYEFLPIELLSKNCIEYHKNEISNLREKVILLIDRYL